MPIKSILTAVSLLGLLSVTGVASAGNCAGPDCRLGVSYIPGPAPQFGPVTIQDRRPMGHLRSVNFQRAPNISIMRVHSLDAAPGLSDAPVAFTEGCHPQSTQYCRQEAGQSAKVNVLAAPAPQPHMTPYTPQVTLPAPVMSQAPAPLQYSSQKVDYSLFQSRQYGDPGFVPGIALVPTSHIDRNPDHADQALNSGRAVPQALANGGVAPRPSLMTQTQSYQQYNGQMSMSSLSGAQHSYGTPMPAPHPRPTPNEIIVPDYVPAPHYGLAGAPVLQNNGSYASTVGADGTYWEKVSGPTMFGDTLASQVICKRQVETRVVNPVIGVPVPVCNLPQPLGSYEGRDQARYPGWSY